MSTITSTQSGDWSQTATWAGGVVPASSDSVIISSGDTVVIDQSIDVGDGGSTALDIRGVLSAHRTNDVTIEVTGGIYIKSGGKLENGSSVSDRCEGRILYQLNKGNGSGTDVGIKISGSISNYGVVRTTITENVTYANTGESTITVGDATGWAAGHNIAMRRIDSFAWTGVHRSTVVSVTPNGDNFDVVIADALPFDLGADAPVVNKSKSIKFERHPNASGRGTAFYHYAFQTVEGEHYEIENTDSGSSSSQGSYTFRTVNNQSVSQINISDVSIHTTESNIRGIEFDTCRLPDSTVTRLVVDLQNNQSVIYSRSGSTVTVQDSVILDGGYLYSAWGQGSSAMSIKRTKIYSSRYSSCVRLISCISYFFEDCDILGGSSSSMYVDITDVGFTQFTRCNFGRTDGDYNITKSAIVNSAGQNTSSAIKFIDCNDSCTSDTLIDLIGDNNTFTNVSPTSYLYINKRGSRTGQNYTRSGRLVIDSTLKNLSDGCLRVMTTGNEVAYNASYGFVCPDSTDFRVEGLYRSISGNTSSNKPTIEISSPSGVYGSQTLSGSDDTWEGFSVSDSQSTGDDEIVDVNFFLDTDANDEGALDFLAIASYGHTTILQKNINILFERSLITGYLVVIPQVTQLESTAQSHTGITITDHETPVSWNGEDFSITVEGDLSVNSSLTLDDIKHYLHYHLNSIQPFAGRETGHHWHDLIPMNGNESAKGDRDGTGVKGVRVIDQDGNSFAGVTRYESDNGSFVSAPRTLTLTGLKPNSEVRIYDSDTTNELGGVENSTSTFSVAISASSVDFVIFNTDYKPIRTVGVNTTSNSTLPIQQIFDRNYSNN